MFPLRVCWIVLFCVICAAVPRKTPYILSDEFIHLINSKQNVWRAGRNFPSNTPLKHLKKLLGALRNDHHSSLKTKVYSPDVIASLPENFDPRDKWPYCPTLNEIRDQGSCGSCWAFGAVEAMTDRYCIKSNGTKHFHFSADDLLACGITDGCSGSTSIKAWNYWQSNGIVSGGSYNSSQGCKPYEIPPCEHHVPGHRMPCDGDDNYAPECTNSCESNYKVKYENDLRYGKNIISLDGEDNIKAELYTNGPVETSFNVYSDFFAYKSGVYMHTVGEYVFGHAVKLMGWGVENGTKYWLLANSWNSDWGDNGYFKFLRGVAHCGIENEIVAGEPILEGEQIEE